MDPAGVLRRILPLAVLASALYCCGGGGGGEGDAGVETLRVPSAYVGRMFSVTVATPLGYDDSERTYPIVFLLDGDVHFSWVRKLLRQMGLDAILAAVNNSSWRERDYLPTTDCTPAGGGNERFFGFLGKELVPYLHASYRIDPSQRVLMGHSYGGIFVLYVLFRDHGDTFSALVANDPPMDCVWDSYMAMATEYAATQTSLPVELYLSAATQGNEDSVTAFLLAAPELPFPDFVSEYDVLAGTHDGVLDDSFFLGLPMILQPR